MATVKDTPPSVHEAWSAVMGTVQGIRKGELAQAGPARFNFRGIDAVMNAVGPAIREHKVHIGPVHVETERRDTVTSGGKPARETCVLVTFRVTGPAGDYFDGMAPGEALDNGDKGTAKAMSVALRTYLLQALCVPTDEPDPDTHHYEREQPSQPAAASNRQAPDPANLVKARILRACGGDQEKARAACAGIDMGSVAELVRVAESLELNQLPQEGAPE